MRHRLAAVAAVVLLASAAWAADFLVEDWSTSTVGTTGLPSGWQAQSWGTPNYALFSIDEDAGRKVLHMRSQNDGSTIAKDVKGKVNLKDTPILEWSWKMVMLPKGANSCLSATDDQAGQVFVMWPRFPEMARSRIIGYVWDTTQPVGTICKSEKTKTVTYVVVRSGQADVGKWFTERRNVVEDFKKIYNDSADHLGAVSVSIDSNDTHSSSESFVGAIRFRAP
jgi:hypothetical protein